MSFVALRGAAAGAGRMLARRGFRASMQAKALRCLHTEVTDGYFELIGDTPLVELKNASRAASDHHKETAPESDVPDAAEMGRVFAKLEGHNPAGSIKDRVITNIVFEKLKKLEDPGDGTVPTLCLVTSGRAGVTMAKISKFISTPKMKMVIVTPANYAEKEAPKILRNNPDVGVVYSFEELEQSDKDCNIVFLPGNFMSVLGTATQHCSDNDDWHIVDQHNDVYSTDAHEITSAEILQQCPSVTDVVCAVGTGATAAGLRLHLPDHINVHARPAESGQIDGIADVDRYDNFCDSGELVGYATEWFNAADAITHQRLLREDGIIAGQSSGATFWLGHKIARANKDARVVIISADGRVEMETGVGLKRDTSPPAARRPAPTTNRQRMAQRNAGRSLSTSTTAADRARGHQRRSFSSAASSSEPAPEWRDHVIIGGGPVGSATAWFLAERGLENAQEEDGSDMPSVALVHDPRNRGAHEDWSRLARLSFDGPKEEFELSQHALELLDLVDEVRSMQSGAEVVPLRPGMLFVASPGTAMAELCARGEGYGDDDFKRVDPSELESLYPGNEFALPSDTLCWTSSKGYCVSPLELAETQRKTAEAYGAELLEGVAGVNVSPRDPSVFEVVTELNDGGTIKFETKKCYLMTGGHNKRLLNESVERGHDALRVTPFDDTYITAISTVRYKHVNHPSTPKEGSGHVVTPIVLGQLKVPDLLPYEANFSIVAEEYGDVLKTRLSGAAGQETIDTVAEMEQLNDDKNEQMAADYQALFGNLFPFLDTSAPLDFNRCITYRNHDPAYSGTSLVAHHIGDEGSDDRGTMLTTVGCFGVGVKFGPALGEAAADFVEGKELVRGMNVLDSRRAPTASDGDFVERAW